MFVPDDMKPLNDFGKKKFQILMTGDYVDSAGQPQIRAIQVDRVLTRDLVTDYPICRRNQFALSFAYDIPNPGDDPYLKKRAEQLYDYLDGLKHDPGQQQKIKIDVEPLTRKHVESRYVTGITIDPKKKTDLAGIFSACLSTDRKSEE